MNEEFNALWLVGGAAVLVLGPAGGVWVGIRGLVSQIKQDREETRDLLKSLETRTTENTSNIARLDERTKSV